MKHGQASLSRREERESGFHHCGGYVGLVQACFMFGKDLITPILTAEIVL